MSTVGDTSVLYCLYRGSPVFPYVSRFSQAPSPPPLSSISCLLLLVILILILERHNSLWSITLEMDIVFAGAGGGISGGCFELTEPALNCEGIS